MQRTSVESSRTDLPPAPRFFVARRSDVLHEIQLPDPQASVVSDVPWGRADELFTPAYWKVQSWLYRLHSPTIQYALGCSLMEEVAICLLGGYGIPAEIGLAAFQRIRSRDLLRHRTGLRDELQRTLEEPLTVLGRTVRYRFAEQKSRYLACAISVLTDDQPPDGSDHEFRYWLLRIPGVGWKTASWITRNWRASDAVAVLDVHLLRAGRLMGLYSADENPQRDYLRLEERYLQFAAALHVDAALLDVLIWRDMRISRSVVRSCFGRSRFEH